MRNVAALWLALLFAWTPLAPASAWLLGSGSACCRHGKKKCCCPGKQDPGGVRIAGQACGGGCGPATLNHGDAPVFALLRNRGRAAAGAAFLTPHTDGDFRIAAVAPHQLLQRPPPPSIQLG